MSKTTISDFEDQISEAKDQFFERFKVMLDLVQNERSTSFDIRKELTNLHNKGNKYFSLFDRSISEYGLKYFKLDQNIRNSKINDAIDLSQTIIKYWNLLKSLENKYDIKVPKPTQRAYSTIQLFIREFEPDEAKKIKSDFQNANLPIHGFITNKPFIDMTKKQQVKFSIIAGFFFLVTLVFIAIFIECPTNFQDNIFKTILALAAAAFAAAIPGLINVNYRGAITASGAIAVFVIVFLFKPAEISDFKSCNKSISGNIFFGETPVENVTIELLITNQTTRTDQFGKFDLPIDFASLSSQTKIRIVNSEIVADTIFIFQKSDLKQPLTITLKKHCVTCKRLKVDGNVDFRNSSCKASYQYISNFIEGFTDRATELGMTANCVRE